jgi:hypothetical protein
MEIPPGGIVVRLMPVVDQQLPSSPPPLTSGLKVITEANTQYLVLEDGTYFTPDRNTNIYDNLLKSSHNKWETYMPGNEKPMSESTKLSLLNKYVDVNESKGGGRSSRKKYKKSSKRGRSMKRNVSKSRKYYRRK